MDFKIEFIFPPKTINHSWVCNVGNNLVYFGNNHSKQRKQYVLLADRVYHAYLLSI